MLVALYAVYDAGAGPCDDPRVWGHALRHQEPGACVPWLRREAPFCVPRTIRANKVKSVYLHAGSQVRHQPTTLGTASGHQD